MIDNKYDENVLHRTLMSLKEFFSEALSKEELETPYYKVHTLFFLFAHLSPDCN